MLSASANISTVDSKSAMKHNSMYKFNCEVREYKQNRTDKLAAGINRYLQLILSYASDISIFDPNTSVTCEFFSNLYELFTMLDTNSQILWSCVNVLDIACKNRAAHYEMMNTYQFVPHLSQMLHDNLQQERKIRILTIIQDLTCGIRIHLITPNLQHLMDIMLKWIHGKETELVMMLSLGVLVNLCFNNKPAQFALVKSVNMKDLSKTLLTFTGQKIQTFAAKLLIILNDIERVSHLKSFGELLDITLRSIQEAYYVKDHLALRQHIEFYLGFQNEDIRMIIEKHCNAYQTVIQNLLRDMVELPKWSGEEMQRTIESNSLLLRFLSSIIAGDLPGVQSHYRQIVRFALDGIAKEMVTADALSLLKSVLAAPQFAHVSEESRKSIVDDIIFNICALAGQLNLIGSRPSIATCAMNNDLFDLLKYFLRCEATREHVLAQLKQEQFDQMFDTIVDNPMDGNSSFSQGALDIYVNALNVVSIAGEFNPGWRQYCARLYAQRHAHDVLALGFVSGRRECRVNAMEILARRGAPDARAIADAMDQVVAADAPAAGTPPSPPLPCETCGKLPEILQALRAARANDQLHVDVCEMMELYEHRIAVGDQATEAAATCAARHQQQLAQLQVVLRRTRTLHLRSERTRRDALQQIGALEAQVAALRVEQKARVRLQAELQDAQADTAKKGECIAALERELKDAHGVRENLEKNVKHLKESMMKLTIHSEHDKEKIKALNVEMQAAKTHCESTKSLLESTQNALQERSEELERALRESEERRQLMEQIMKLMHSQK